MNDNPYKGTFDAEIAGETYSLRPSFDALIEFEELTGVSANVACERLGKGELSAKIIVGAIWAGIQGEAFARNDKSYCPGYRVIGELIRRDGMAKALKVAIKVLMYGIIPHDEVCRIEEGAKTESKKQ